MAAAAYYDAVQKLYIAYYGRPADPLGLQYWSNEIEKAGGKIDAVVNAFGNSDEAKAIYGDLGLAAQINNVYQNILGRPAETGGLTWYAQEIQAGRITLAGLAQAVIAGANGADATVVANKLVVAKAFTDAVDDSAQSIVAYNGEAAAGIARDFLATVTADTASVTAATGNVASTVSSLNGALTGETFTLKVGADTVVGTAGNDVINALTVNAATGDSATTLNGFDSIDGGNGNDTLNIYTDGASHNGTLASSATIKNVETINIYNDTVKFNTGVVNTVDASKFVGATAINQNGLAANVINLAAGTTAGFKSITTAAAALQVTAADAATSAAVALTDVKDDASLAVLATGTGTLNTVTVTGNVVDSAANGVDKISLTVTGGKDVQSLTINSAVGANLSVGTNGKAVTAINAAGSTGALTFNLDGTANPADVGTNTDVANLTTGSGNDVVGLATALSSTVKSASVSTGAGDDKLFVNVDNTAAITDGTVAVDAGDGKDTIKLAIASGVAYDVKAGAGDDAVVITGTVKTTDKIDGGDGVDTVSLTGKATYLADDYIVLNKVLTNFETLQLTSTAVSDLDAAKLAANYTTLDLYTGSKVDNVSAQALIANGALTAEAAGYKSAAESLAAGGANAIVYAGTLNITDKGLAAAADAIQAHAETVNLTITGGKANGVAANNAVLTGEAKTVTVTLSAGTDTKATATDTSDDALVASQVTVAQGTAADTLKDLSSLTLSGNGKAIVNVGAAGGDFKLVTVDASALNSVNEKGAAVAGLVYTSFNNNAETIKLGAGLDTVTLNASTYGKMDTITGLNLVLNSAKTALDTAKSDTLVITDFGDLQAAGKMTTTQTDLDLALKDAAAFKVGGVDVDVVAFQLGGDTYLFSDKGTAGSIDAADIVVKLTGTVDLDTLVLALN